MRNFYSVGICMPEVQDIAEREVVALKPVGRRFMISYFLAFVFLWATSLPPTFISLALKIKALVGMDQATDALGLVLGCGAMVSMLAGPIIGKLSDSTSSALGRRRPWMILGVFLAVGASVFCGNAQSVLTLIGAYCLFQLGLNAIVAGLCALLLDRIPSELHTRFSGLLAISIPCGMVIGAFLVNFISHNFVAVFLLPALLMAAAVLFFCAILDEAPFVAGQSATPKPLEKNLSSNSDQPGRNFAILMSGRFLMGGALSVLTTYQTYFLDVGLGVSADQIPQRVAFTMLTFAIATVLAGCWVTFADHAKRHKKSYSASASFFAGVVFLLIGIAPSFELYLAFVVLSGIAWGLFSAVENALVATVLTTRNDSARDLGIYRASAILPQMIVPLVGAVAISTLNASYTSLFASAGVLAFLSGLSMLKVKLA
jgi:MFS family permease